MKQRDNIIIARNLMYVQMFGEDDQFVTIWTAISS